MFQQFFITSPIHQGSTFSNHLPTDCLAWTTVVHTGIHFDTTSRRTTPDYSRLADDSPTKLLTAFLTTWTFNVRANLRRRLTFRTNPLTLPRGLGLAPLLIIFFGPLIFGVLHTLGWPFPLFYGGIHSPWGSSLVGVLETPNFWTLWGQGLWPFFERTVFSAFFSLAQELSGPLYWPFTRTSHRFFPFSLGRVCPQWGLTRALSTDTSIWVSPHIVERKRKTPLVSGETPKK